MARVPIRNDPYVDRLRGIFRERFGKDLEFVQTPEGESAPGNDSLFAFYRRAVNYHHVMVPWIESVFDLSDASVLEIGCGSGSASLALAQRCRRVDAFDIDIPSITEGRDWARTLDVDNIVFGELEPDWALDSEIHKFPGKVGKKYDVILLAAVLEHLLQEERVPVLRTLWSLLRSGGIMVVYDTPNRLYPFDSHTFRLPFAQWLPDDLMLQYLPNSPRKELTESIESSTSPKQTMGRFGRGVSYHEFDVAIGLGNMTVLNDGYSSLITHRARNTAHEGMIADTIAKHEPFVPPGFTKDYLELVIRKKWEPLELAGSSGLSVQILNGQHRAHLLQNEGSHVTYSLPEGGPRCLRLEVLNHPWSASLSVCGEDDAEIHAENLFLDYPILRQIDVALPPTLGAVTLRVIADPQSQGAQAWILGAGLV